MIQLPSINRFTDNKNAAASQRCDAGCCGLLMAVVVAFFWKTVFLGQAISKFNLYTLWDSLFYAYRSGPAVTVDPSGIYTGIPTFKYIAQLYHQGQLPLWNDCNAFGAPLVGDIQAAVFSPLRLIFDIFPTMYVYNLQLVGQIVIAAIGSFMLARTLSLGRLPSLLCALSYALCPYILWYLEPAISPLFVAIPAVWLLFIWLALHPAIWRAVVVGIGAGVMILSGHPEVSFFSISSGCLLGFFFCRRSLLYLSLIVIAGGCCLCVCAPIFIPFIEFMRNSDCYKFETIGSSGGGGGVPWQALAYNLLSPGFGGASPFLGVLTAALLPFAFAKETRSTSLRIGLICVLSFMSAAGIWPASLLFSHGPLSYVATVYFIPLFLLSLAVLSALGLQSLMVLFKKDAWLVVSVFALLLFACALTPYVLNAMHISLSCIYFDYSLPGMAFSTVAFGRNLVIASLAAILLLLASVNKKLSGWACAGLVVLNTVSVCYAAKASLPVQPSFEAPVIVPMQFLQDKNERVVAIGDHLFRPNTNLLYGIDDVRSRSAMWPPRYLKFIRACGAKKDLYTQVFSGKLPRLLDLCSVRYVLTQVPVSTAGDNSGAPSSNFPAAQPRFVLQKQFGNSIFIYKNTCALPRAYIVPQVVYAHSEDEAFKHIKKMDFDPRKGVVIETPLTRSGSMSVGSSAATTEQSAVSESHSISAKQSVVDKDAQHSVRPHNFVSIQRLPTFVTVKYMTDVAGYLVLTDTFYPGWKAYLDNHLVSIMRANYMFRAVKVPAGTHTIIFRYEPLSFAIGVAMFAAFWMLLLLCIVLFWFTNGWYAVHQNDGKQTPAI